MLAGLVAGALIYGCSLVESRLSEHAQSYLQRLGERCQAATLTPTLSHMCDPDDSEFDELWKLRRKTWNAATASPVSKALRILIGAPTFSERTSDYQRASVRQVMDELDPANWAKAPDEEKESLLTWQLAGTALSPLFR